MRRPSTLAPRLAAPQSRAWQSACSIRRERRIPDATTAPTVLRPAGALASAPGADCSWRRDQEDSEDAQAALASLEAAIACLRILGAPGMPQQARAAPRAAGQAAHVAGRALHAASGAVRGAAGMPMTCDARAGQLL